MTDEQAVRASITSLRDHYCVNTNGWNEWDAALALLDAKDTDLREYKGALAFTVSERDTALSRAEQAKTNSAEWASKAGRYDRERREAEAALAEERKAHQAFRVEVSQLASWVKINLTDLILGDVSSISYPTRFSTRTVERLASNCRKYLPDLSRFILPAKPADPDPLVGILTEVWRNSDNGQHGDNVSWEEGWAKDLRAAIERAGGTISFEGEGDRCEHNWRYSDSSLYDEVCTKCGETDRS